MSILDDPPQALLSLYKFNNQKFRVVSNCSTFDDVKNFFKLNIEKFDYAEIFIRELVQNALDAKVQHNNDPVTLDLEILDFSLAPHRNVYNRLIDPQILELLRKSRDIDKKLDLTYKVLRISDNNTTGLSGDILNEKSNWYKYFIKIGNLTDLSKNDSLGSANLGKVAIWMCSNLWMVFARSCIGDKKFRFQGRCLRSENTPDDKDPNTINPLSSVDLVIDHSVQVDKFANKNSLKENVDIEFNRNAERYSFLKWGQQAFNNFRIVPPGTGICHQVNLEYLSKVVWNEKYKNEEYIFPDTLVGTDSHTTMVNGLSVLGWGVGGIEAEAGMLGQPISMLIPEVVGFEMKSKMPEGTTAVSYTHLTLPTSDLV